MNWLKPNDQILHVPFDCLSELSVDEFTVDVPRRLDVRVSGVDIPLLIVRRADSSRLTVLNNGAVDLKRSEGLPIFQRSSWWQEIHSHQIYVCDPGTVGAEAVALNWFQTAPPIWLGSKTAVVARTIANLLDVRRPSHRTYYGSSAGGFAALMQLCADSQARGIVNNAQFDWTRWYAHHVTPVLEKHFDGRLAAEVRTRWPHRANVLKYLTRRSSGLFIDYHVNMASTYDRDIQLPIFNHFLLENPELCGSVTVRYYFDEVQNHNPLPKEETIRILNARPGPTTEVSG